MTILLVLTFCIGASDCKDVRIPVQGIVSNCAIIAQQYAAMNAADGYELRSWRCEEPKA